MCATIHGELYVFKYRLLLILNCNTILYMKDILVDTSAQRHILDFRLLGIQDVAVLGRYDYASARKPLKVHKHKDMLEICLMESGRQNYVVAGHKYSLTGGDLFLTYPNEQHSTGDHPEEKGVLYWMLIPMPNPRHRFLQLPPVQGQEIIRRLLCECPRQFKSNATIKKTVKQIFSVYAQKKDTLQTANLNNLLLRFLLDLLLCAKDQKEQPLTPEISHVLTVIGSHLHEALSLSYLANEINLSVPRFKVRFKQEVGTPPAQYIMHQKVEKAKTLLRTESCTITDIAMQLGFDTSQYFSTAFKHYTGQTPTDYKRKQST